MERPEYRLQFTYMQTLDYAKACNDYIDNLEQKLATAMQEATAYRISLENLEASLPKVRADAVREAAETCGEYVGGEEACAYYSDLLDYADEMEAGNE